MNRVCILLLMGATVLPACEGPPQSGQAQADAETRSACQQRAEQADQQQNRGEIFSPPSPVNSPYSANYLPSVSDRGLSEIFVHDRMVSDCIRNTGTGSERSLPPAASTAPIPKH
jgi:hypothetical protein